MAIFRIPSRRVELKNTLLYILFAMFACLPKMSFGQDSTAIDSLILLASSLHYVDPETADSIYLQTLEQSKQINYKNGQAFSYKGIGVIADVQNNPEKSILAYAEATALFLEQGDSLNAYKVKFNEAMVYQNEGKHEMSGNIFLEAKAVFLRYDFPYGAVLCNQNYGIALFERQEYRQALDVFREVEQQHLSLGMVDLNVIGNMGNCYSFLDSSDKAIEYWSRAYQIAEETDNVYSMAHWALPLAQELYENNKLEESKKYFETAHVYAKENGLMKQLQLSSRYLSVIAEKRGAFEEGFYYLRDLLRANDSVYNADFSVQLSEKEAIIENERTAKENASLRESEKLATLQSEQDALIRNIVIAGGVLMLIGVFFLVRLNRKRKALNDLLSVKNEQIEEQHKEIQSSINYAQHIQSALLTEDTEWQKISPDFFLLLKPKDVVSGDFYWAFHAEKENISIWVAADCTGHGVPGAFMSMLGIGFLNEIVIEGGITDGAEILNRLRDKIIKALLQKNTNVQRKDGIDLALCVLNKNTNELEFAGANNPLYVVRKSNLVADSLKPFIKEHDANLSLLELPANKMPVGFHGEEQHAFQSCKIKVEKGDCIYSFSDGMPDQFGGLHGKKYKYKQFRELILSLGSVPFAEQKKHIQSAYENWKGDFEQIDDVCVVGINV